MKVYLLSSSMRAILASNRANFIPIQIHGPKPNGMWQSCGLLAFSSGVNLQKKQQKKQQLNFNEGSRAINQSGLTQN